MHSLVPLLPSVSEPNRSPDFESKLGINLMLCWSRLASSVQVVTSCNRATAAVEQLRAPEMHVLPPRFALFPYTRDAFHVQTDSAKRAQAVQSAVRSASFR